MVGLGDDLTMAEYYTCPPSPLTQPRSIIGLSASFMSWWDSPIVHHSEVMLYNMFRIDLLPFYSRLVATLHPCMADLAVDLFTSLKAEFKWHVSYNDLVCVLCCICCLVYCICVVSCLRGVALCSVVIMTTTNH